MKHRNCYTNAVKLWVIRNSNLILYKKFLINYFLFMPINNNNPYKNKNIKFL